MTIGTKLDRYIWNLVQHGSGVPDTNTKGNIYIDDLTGITWTKASGGSWGQQELGDLWTVSSDRLTPSTATHGLYFNCSNVIDLTTSSTSNYSSREAMLIGTGSTIGISSTGKARINGGDELEVSYASGIGISTGGSIVLSYATGLTGAGGGPISLTSGGTGDISLTSSGSSGDISLTANGGSGNLSLSTSGGSGDISIAAVGGAPDVTVSCTGGSTGVIGISSTGGGTSSIALATASSGTGDISFTTTSCRTGSFSFLVSTSAGQGNFTANLTAATKGAFELTNGYGFIKIGARDTHNPLHLWSNHSDILIETDAAACSTDIRLDSCDDIYLDAVGEISIDSHFDSNFTITANDIANQTLTIAASNAGAGVGNIAISADGTILLDSVGVLELNSSAGVISIGNDAVAQNINIGTGAAARGITVGNDTTTTSLTLTSGSGNIYLNGGIKHKITTVAAATHTLVATDSVLMVTYTSTGVVTVTIPTTEIAKAGRIFTIVDSGGSALTNNISIETEGAETISGEANLIMDVDYMVITLMSDGTNLFVV
jgi:hypothetical protein